MAARSVAGHADEIPAVSRRPDVSQRHGRAVMQESVWGSSRTRWTAATRSANPPARARRTAVGVRRRDRARQRGRETQQSRSDLGPQARKETPVRNRSVHVMSLDGSPGQTNHPTTRSGTTGAKLDRRRPRKETDGKDRPEPEHLPRRAHATFARHAGVRRSKRLGHVPLLSWFPAQAPVPVALAAFAVPSASRRPEGSIKGSIPTARW
jgi:hypothetical protein